MQKQRGSSETMLQGVPGGSVIKNLLAGAGDTGSIPSLGRSHMPQSNSTCVLQLLSIVLQSLGGTTTEACEPQSPFSATKEATVMRSPCKAQAPQLESSPDSPQLEKSPCSNEDSAQPKRKKKIFVLKDNSTTVIKHGPGSSSRGIHNNKSEFFCRN